MPRFLVTVTKTLKTGVNDPQGNTIMEALHSLGFPTVESLRTGGFYTWFWEAEGPEEAKERAKEIIAHRQMGLVNTVLETYTIEVEEEQ